MEVASSGGSDVALRSASAVVMAAAALGTAYLGGWPFAAFWIAAGVLVAIEWQRMLAGPAVLWRLGGVATALAVAAAPIVLRRDPDYGLIAILWLFAVVWSTDIAAYFVGRALGGPKLWRRVSPKKTWSGAIGGIAGGTAAGLGVASWSGIPTAVPALLAIGAAVSLVTQAGDLAESALKRHMGVKDSGTIIPGHGGVMDRLDGFAVAALAAVVLGALRVDLGQAARGLLVW